jgi:hypothetical protein
MVAPQFAQAKAILYSLSFDKPADFGANFPLLRPLRI